MKPVHLRLIAVLALGLVAAVVFYFSAEIRDNPDGQSVIPASKPSVTGEVSPESEAPEEMPSPEEPATAEESPTEAPTTVSSPSPEPTASPTPQPSRTPKPSRTPSASMSPSAAKSASPEPSASSSLGAGSSVSGLHIAKNSRDMLVVRWQPIPGAAYQVFINSSLIATVTDPEAWLKWETPTMQVGVAPVLNGKTGKMVTINASRPVPAPAPPGTEPGPIEQPTDTETGEPEELAEPGDQ